MLYSHVQTKETSQ